MKHTMKICASLVLAGFIAACSQQAPEEPAAAVSTPTETAEEFVARAYPDELIAFARSNAELKELGRELGAASWVRSTYITGDTAIIAAAASERYAKWHSEMVQQALQYEGQELDATTRRALELLKLGAASPFCYSL